MYYAAAATALLRSYGIPTRYVEGYIISAADMDKSKEVDNLEYTQDIINLDTKHYDFVGSQIYEYAIKDKNGHAWVEVYLGGIGWVPVEVTSSRLAQEESHISQEHIQPPTQTFEPEVTTTPSEVPSGKETQVPEHNEEHESPKDTSKGKKVDKNKEKRIYSEGFMIFMYITVILLTGIMGIVCIKIKKIKSHVDKYKRLIRTNEIEYIKEILGYIFEKNNIIFTNNMKYSEYVSKITVQYNDYNKEDLENVIHSILRDKYSKESITNEEKQGIVKFYNYVVDAYTRDRNSFDKKYESYTKKYIQKL